MKLRLLPLSILLVASLAACQKNAPSASVTVNPNAPDPKDSTVKIADNKWNWGGVEPFSYKFNGQLVKSAQDLSFYRSSTSATGVSMTTFYSWSDSGSYSGDDTLMNLWLPDLVKDMKIGQEYMLPTQMSSGAQLFKFDYVPYDVSIKTAFYMTPLDGGNLRVKITNISATEIEGKFYGVLKQKSDIKSSSGVGWVKIEEGYFKYNLKDTTWGATP